MYAHQVIEDLKLIDYKYRHELTTGIKKSVHFDAGDISAYKDLLLKICNNPDGENHASVYGDYIKAPYSTVWIYFTTLNKYKYGSLMFNEGNRFAIIPFFYDQGQWFVNPQVLMLQGGELFPSFPFVDIPPQYLQQCEDVAFLAYGVTISVLILLNCKNITSEIIKAPEALNKKRRKNGKQEIFDYHILNVTVPGKKREYREQSEPLSHVRVHLCRGHFKEYTKDHPLFGKLTGLYWWQPHVRGQNKEGIVMKDYAIKAQEA